jgi:hypothetical protein
MLLIPVLAWAVNLALCVVTLVSTLVLSYFLKKDNKKIDETAASYIMEDGGSNGKEGIETHHNEHCTTGRDGSRAGAYVKYQT